MSAVTKKDNFSPPEIHFDKLMCFSGFVSCGVDPSPASTMLKGRFRCRSLNLSVALLATAAEHTFITEISTIHLTGVDD